MNKIITKKICILLLAVTIIFVVMPITVSQAADITVEEMEPGAFLTTFRQILDEISSRLIKYARSLFIVLATIQFN